MKTEKDEKGNRIVAIKGGGDQKWKQREWTREDQRDFRSKEKPSRKS